MHRNENTFFPSGKKTIKNIYRSLFSAWKICDLKRALVHAVVMSLRSTSFKQLENISHLLEIEIQWKFPVGFSLKTEVGDIQSKQIRKYSKGQTTYSLTIRAHIYLKICMHIYVHLLHYQKNVFLPFVLLC